MIMRILLYTMNGYPFEGAIQPIYAAVLGSLQEAGHTVTVLTATPHSTPDVAEPWEGAEVVGAWTWSPAFLHRYPILTRALGGVTFCLASLVVGLLLPRKFDLVLTAPHPPIAIGLNTRLIAQAKGCPFVYCVEDIYPDVLVEAGLMRCSMLFRLLRYLERGIYRKAGRVCVLSESVKSNLMAKKIPSDKIQIVPCFADTTIGPAGLSCTRVVFYCTPET
jgi:colanic acid biosynthesis glycosyl transferase WcaI